MATRKKIAGPDTSQISISSLFAKAKHDPKPSSATTSTVSASGGAGSVLSTSSSPLTSDDPEIQEYYNQLKPSEVITHNIAIIKLGTSYDVTRTHGFLRWKRARSTLTK